MLRSLLLKLKHRARRVFLTPAVLVVVVYLVWVPPRTLPPPQLPAATTQLLAGGAVGSATLSEDTPVAGSTTTAKTKMVQQVDEWRKVAQQPASRRAKASNTDKNQAAQEHSKNIVVELGKKGPAPSTASDAQASLQSPGSLPLPPPSDGKVVEESETHNKQFVDAHLLRTGTDAEYLSFLLRFRGVGEPKSWSLRGLEPKEFLLISLAKLLPRSAGNNNCDLPVYTVHCRVG